MRKRKAEPIAAELVVSTGTVRVPAEIVPSNAEDFQRAITETRRAKGQRSAERRAFSLSAVVSAESGLRGNPEKTDDL